MVEIMDPGDGLIHRKTHAEFAEEWTGVLILLSPNQEFTARNEKVPVLARFRFLLYPHRKILVQALVGAIIYTVLGLSTSIYIQKITDFVLPDGNRNLLNLLSIGMVIILALQIVIGSLQSVFILKTGQLIDARLILGYYKTFASVTSTLFRYHAHRRNHFEDQRCCQNPGIYQRYHDQHSGQPIYRRFLFCPDVYLQHETGLDHGDCDPTLCPALLDYQPTQ